MAVISILKAKDFVQENKSALFDWFVFGISFSLGFIFPTLKDFTDSALFSYFILASLLLYTAGAWLKHIPLANRMSRSGEAPKEVPLLLFLLVGHWCIMIPLIVFSVPAIKTITGIPLTRATDDSPGWLLIVGGLIAASFITWLVYRTKSSRKNISKSPASYLFRRELVADIFLLIAVSILSFAFWEKGVIAMLTKVPVAHISDIWFLFLFLSITFMLCYLPLRYLFLVEDHSSRSTWKRLLLIFGFLLIKSLLQMLNI